MSNTVFSTTHTFKDQVSDSGTAQPAIVPAVILGPSGSHLTPEINDLLESYMYALTSARKGYTYIHVDEIASRIAKLYELIRKVIDWKEDSELRRGAIERILKRLLFGKLSPITLGVEPDPNGLAETVTLELIRSGHLPNDEVPRESIEVVSRSLTKYLYFLKQNPATVDPLRMKHNMNYFTFLIEIAACEIEEILTVPIKENGLMYAMTQLMDERTKIHPEGSLTPEDKKIQVYIATCRTLFDLDDAFISYQLLKIWYPDWNALSHTDTENVNNQMSTIREHLTKTLDHPIGKDLNVQCERIDTVFALIGDVMDKFKDKPEEVKAAFENKETLTALITEAYEKRRTTLKSRLIKLGVFSTLSVFLSNWFTFYIVEIPLAKIFYEGFNLFTAFIDFLVPTVVMAVLVSIIRPPDDKNLTRVLTAVKGFVYQNEKRQLYEVYLRKKRRSDVSFIMGLMYLASTVVVFGFVGWIFYIAKLPITSVIFDTLTIALTVFAAVMIRNKSKELTVNEGRSVREFLLDMISVPIAKVGSILAAKWKEYNVISIFFNFVIETPFAMILDFIEHWSEYLKERRAELR